MSNPGTPHNRNGNGHGGDSSESSIDTWIAQELSPFLRETYGTDHGFMDEILAARRYLRLLEEVERNPGAVIGVITALGDHHSADHTPHIRQLIDDPNNAIAVLLWYRMRHGELPTISAHLTRQAQVDGQLAPRATNGHIGASNPASPLPVAYNGSGFGHFNTSGPRSQLPHGTQSHRVARDPFMVPMGDSTSLNRRSEPRPSDFLSHPGQLPAPDISLRIGGPNENNIGNRRGAGSGLTISTSGPFFQPPRNAFAALMSSAPFENQTPGPHFGESAQSRLRESRSFDEQFVKKRTPYSATIVDQLRSRRNVPQPPPALSARLSVPNLPRGVIMDLGGAAANDPFAGGLERPGTSPLRTIFSSIDLVGLNTQGNMRQGVIDEDDENGGETQHSA
ncbi:hypothetical protein BS50DRAFT_645426 [Corynespora cassiicola Philippines]|uniref:Uncharacterized protein n=1 Tax=Corynespora cassiicola Philippines TaxID=1448308 RepID=A0A2T2NIN9_CORCC|nr:hypothetical protein BS50DRAFT_645426 [Corynespora cassiicola Philippines]